MFASTVYSIQLSTFKWILVCLVLCFGLQSVQAQQVWKNQYYSAEDNLLIKTKPFSAFTIRVKKTVTIPFTIQGQNPTIEWDEHVNNSTYRQSILYFKQDSVLKLSKCKGLTVQIVFQLVPSISSSSNDKIERRNLCNQPEMIPPSFWRQGLTPPAPNPQSNVFRHCIVHHSAGGNGNTNYTDLVRNYYVQHTQVNGWDDIGYNFLVAHNGTIYIGRDKQSLQEPYYNVKGAHFCGKNAGTAGVCLIGNYNDTAPSDTMLGSLVKVMSWMFFEATRNALDSTPHPSPTDANLDHIAGHRQGCATACPGDSVYRLLDSIRLHTEVKRQECNQFAHVDRTQSAPLTFVVRSGSVTFSEIDDWTLYSLLGERLAFSNPHHPQERTLYLQPGIYLIVHKTGATKIIIPSD